MAPEAIWFTSDCGPFVCYVSLLHHIKIQIKRKLKRKRKQKRNGGGHLRGALRAPRAGSPACIFAFVFVLNLRLILNFDIIGFDIVGFEIVRFDIVGFDIDGFDIVGFDIVVDVECLTTGVLNYTFESS